MPATVGGWFTHLRSSGKVAFIVMRDGTGLLQCVVPKKEVSEETWERFGQLTGRHYDLVEYYGAPDAERVVVAMGSAVHTLRAAADVLNAAGEKVGVANVRMYRPFPAAELVAALPASVKAIAVLDLSLIPI